MLANRKIVNRKQNERGFTLVEVTIILLVLVIISMIMLPQLGNFNRLARKVKVAEDLAAICATMKKFLDEVLVPGPFDDPGGHVAAPVGPVGLLVGPGTPPPADVASAGPPNGDWTLTEADTFDETPDILSGVAAPLATTFEVDSFDEHLQFNRPLSAAGAAGYAERYRNQIDDPTVGPFLGWRGPMFDMFTPDPWGGRYMSNTFGLHSGTNGNTFSTAVVCYSAGGNRVAESAINQPQGVAPYGWVTGGDDIAVVLSAMGPF